MRVDLPPLVIIGAGGHGAVVADCARLVFPKRKINVYDNSEVDGKLLGFEVQHTDRLKGSIEGTYRFIVAIGDNKIRQNVFAEFLSKGGQAETLVHPDAVVSKWAAIGVGSVVLAGAVVNAQAIIGRGAIVNTSAVIEHDCILGDFVHASPGAVVAGGASVGDRSWIGGNAVVKQGVVIGDDVVIGALSLANKANYRTGTYVGTPARPI